MNFLAPLPTQVRSTPDLVALRLREAIFTGELRPGDQLPTEAELAKGFGIALMTVRVALAAMKDLGLLDTVRGRNGGTFVASNIGERIAEAARRTPMTKTELRDLTDWRRAISGEACFLAAKRADANEITRIQLAAHTFDELLPKLPDTRFADVRFHGLIAEASKSQSLIRGEIEIQRILTEVILAIEKPRELKKIAGSCHDGIMAAIASGDGEDARQAMLEHAEETFTWATLLL
ncbi:FadR/GntR family transcriptional regulator [Pseudomonas sp. S2_A02]